MNRTTLYNVIKKLWSHLGLRRKYQFIILLIIAFFASISELVTIGAIFPFLAAIASPEKIQNFTYLKNILFFLNLKNSKEVLFFITMLFTISILISGCLRLILLWFQTRLSHAIGADLSYKIYRRTLYQPYSQHVSRNTSEIISGITNKVSAIVHYGLIPILTIFSSSLIFIMIFFALIFMSPKISFLAIFGFALIYFIVVQITKKKLKLNGEKVSKNSVLVIKALQEGLGGIRDVLIDGTQEVYCDIYKKADIPARRAEANISIISSSPRLLIETLAMILISFLAYKLTITDGNTSNISILGGLAMGAQRLLPVLQQIYLSWANMKGGQASINEGLILLEQPLPEYLRDNNEEIIKFSSSISLHNLTFRYSENTQLVLDNINIIIDKGLKIGIIGSTGSGKSTLLDVVMGLLLPTGGNIKIDETIVTNKNYRSWQSKIAHVPQMIFLSDSTISENIAFGVPYNLIDFERVKKCAEMAKLDETISNWAQKYNTSVGERGVKLSGGQRQRIGIARALYKNSEIIIFDEATSALDNDTEKAVMNSIEELSSDLTIIIVAHRLTTLKLCDIIYELKNGKIHRSGSYNDIINN